MVKGFRPGRKRTKAQQVNAFDSVFAELGATDEEMRYVMTEKTPVVLAFTKLFRVYAFGRSGHRDKEKVKELFKLVRREVKMRTPKTVRIKRFLLFIIKALIFWRKQ